MQLTGLQNERIDAGLPIVHAFSSRFFNTRYNGDWGLYSGSMPEYLQNLVPDLSTQTFGCGLVHESCPSSDDVIIRKKYREANTPYNVD